MSPKNKKIVIAAAVLVLVCALAVTAVILVKKSDGKPQNSPSETATQTVPYIEPSGSYREVAEQFIDCIMRADFNAARKFCLIDVCSLYDQMATEDPEFFKSMCDDIAEKYNNYYKENITVSSGEEAYYYYGKLAEAHIEKFKTTAEIKSYVNLDLKYLKEEVMLVLAASDWVDYSYYDTASYVKLRVDENKIMDAVEVSLTTYSEDVKIATVTFYIVNYNGEWKMATDPFLAMEVMFNK